MCSRNPYEVGGGNTSSSSKKEFVPPEGNKKGKEATMVKKEEGETLLVHIVKRKGMQMQSVGNRILS